MEDTTSHENPRENSKQRSFSVHGQGNGGTQFNMPIGLMLGRKGSINVDVNHNQVDSLGPSPWRDAAGFVATRALQTLIVLTFVAVLVIALNKLSLLIIPVLLALIIACALRPVLAKLEGLGLKPMTATWVTLLGAIVVVGSIVTLIVNSVRHQWGELADSASDGLETLQEMLEDLPFAITTEQIEGFKESITGFLTSSQFGSTAIAGVSATGSFVTGLFLMFVVLFFFMKDGPQIWEFLLRPFDQEHYSRAKRIGTRTVSTLGHYVRGTATVAAVDAIGIGAGLLILGVPLALPLAVITFALAFIPLVGATLAGVLAALVALVSVGWVKALIVVAIVIVVNQLEGNFLQPKIMGKSLELHPLVILLALTAGTILGGVLGAVLSVPVAAVAWGILNVWNGPNEPASFVARKARPITQAEPTEA